jgi:uncharacterized membrane protein YkvA (DUF1232 family)
VHRSSTRTNAPTTLGTLSALSSSMESTNTPTLFSVPSSSVESVRPSSQKRVEVVELNEVPQSGPAFHVADDIDSAMPPPKGAMAPWIERFARKWGRPHLQRLAARRGKLTSSLRTVPQKMHRTALQSELMLELIDDFKMGRYRTVPWRSVAVITGALLYTVHPADVVPDLLPVVGGMDDVILIGLAIRLVQRDLKNYCYYKGYDVARYFGEDEQPVTVKP